MTFASPEKRRRRCKSLTLMNMSTIEDQSNIETSSSTLLVPQPLSSSSFTSSGTSSSSCSVLCCAENYFLKKENEELKEITTRGREMAYDTIKDNDEMISAYTGLPTGEHFIVLSQMLQRFKINYYLKWTVETLSFDDQLLCALMKLRLNLISADLAHRFKVSKTTIQNIVVTFIHLIHQVLFKGLMGNNIPSREKNKFHQPACFSPFPNTRIVLDCTEIQVAIPFKMSEKKTLFSHYKQRHTLNVLIGVAPNATITFVSKLFPGSFSDQKITNDSKILTHLQAGDIILSDKGFLILGICQPLGVHVNMPPFLNNPQFTKEEVFATQRVARARIHVVRAIGRIKKNTGI